MDRLINNECNHLLQSLYVLFIIYFPIWVTDDFFIYLVVQFLFLTCVCFSSPMQHDLQRGCEVFLVLKYLHLPFYSFKRVGEGLGDSGCETAINEVLQGSEAKRRLLPEFVQVHVNCIASNREGKRTCRRMKCTVSYSIINDVCR